MYANDFKGYVVPAAYQIVNQNNLNTESWGTILVNTDYIKASQAEPGVFKCPLGLDEPINFNAIGPIDTTIPTSPWDTRANTPWILQSTGLRHSGDPILILGVWYGINANPPADQQSTSSQSPCRRIPNNDGSTTDTKMSMIPKGADTVFLYDGVYSTFAAPTPAETRVARQ